MAYAHATRISTPLSIVLLILNKFSGELKYPLMLRIWWCVFFFVSCYCLVIDYVFYQTHQFLVSDIVYSVTGFYLCCVGFWGKIRSTEDAHLQESLLSANSTTRLSRGDETVTPYATANIFSILTFSWLGSLVSLGYKKPLDLEDVPQLGGFDSVHGAFPLLRDRLEFDYDDNNSVTTFGLIKALIFTTWKEILLTAFLAITNTVATYVGPYLVDAFVQYLNGQREFKNEGYFLVSAFLVAKFIECLTLRHWFFRLQQVGIRAKAALIALIYHKGLTLSCQSKQGHTSGEIINFMTVDAERIGDFSWCMHDPWVVFLQVGLALVILYKTLGVASIATLVATVAVMLANLPLGRLQENFQTNLMKYKDQRMKTTSEILRNMRILKLQGWEMKFLSKIEELRNSEAGWLKKYVYINAMVSFVFWGTPTFVAVVTFGTCMLIGIPLESGKILSALATFRILQEPIYNLPDTISITIQTKVSLDRIASFLRLVDIQTDVVRRLPRGSSDTALEIVDGNFSWDVCAPKPTLKDINFRVSHGMRVAVCGMVGSGKSSLLSCILGEVPKFSGVIEISGTKAYVAQTPWIQSGTIEENVLFGEKMDKERYEKILEACCLKKDLEVLSFGDQTVIGERGINLSGGQKQRIQIARALYQDAEIYLFDDPFSAVDAHTGSHLFKECVQGILESKTVIYVTHQVEFLPAADLILVMKDGCITQSGKYGEVLNLGSEFMELVVAHEKALSAIDPIEAGFVSKDNMTENIKSSEETRDVEYDKPPEDIMGPKGQLVQEEEREKGRVLQIGSNYWMVWATPVSENVAPPVKSSTLIIVYVELAIGSSFCIFCRAMSLATAGYKTATVLFRRMHFCIFRAPMSFFDSTPSGRILNRASTDQSTIDLNMPNQVGLFAFSIIQLLGIIVVMSQVAWQVFVVFVPVIAICIWLQQYYIPSARELARLIGVSKAPVIQHFAETISGSTTIRSFDQEHRFQETSMKLIDGNSRPKFHSAGVMEWLCFRLDMLSNLTFAFTLVFLISVPVGTIDPSIAGLAVTYGLGLNMLQFRVIWNLCNLDNKIISVERILQYTSIPNEPPLIIEVNSPDDHWPSCGEVDICNLQVRYAPHMPLVLRGLTCTFKGGKKTGIVGRTGSGKSTLIQTIFRIVEPTAGIISIDGINISLIGLHDLRSRLSIIPQDPTMFEGTVRSNLDPLEEYTDEQIWEVLDKCQLGDEVRNKEDKLYSAVSENGENWSVGQRQLVCLGRVLLKKSKDSTVLTIAHRITSVLDSDMVLLLDNGLVEEYDIPAKLLENNMSSFSKLVAEKNEVTENGISQEPLLDPDFSRLSNGGECKKSEGGETVTPYASANILSILTFSWIGSLVALGYRKPLDLEDVPQVASIDSVKGAFPLLRDKLGYDGGGDSSVTTLKLAKALFYAMWKEILLTAFFAMMNTVASYVGPYLIDTFVQYLNARQGLKEGYFLVSAFVISKLIECLAQRHWFFKVQQIGTRGKAALIALIYHKGLNLSCQSKQGNTSGEIINIMTVDAERIGVFSWYVHDLWLVILQVGLALAILYKNLGLASIATLVTTVIVMLVNIPLGRLQENFQTKLMKSKDHRMKATSEILKNMRILDVVKGNRFFLLK
ncbi:ABC-type xenobiotic transporter [Heracleum sosnowskyi]|uniref:ABC-type xenobiotic transporter n=1 Tax=Heracleum sosnowskyi TaxID=360622 RepID=A0AAD8N575_9APIA|nr:ABC-type xenobiotic transporter [Heracleum sosnowskyi]